MDALSDFVAVDLETTGMSPGFDEIIELAAVRFRDGKEVAAYSALVNPGWEIGGFITDLTGITDEMLAGQPSIREALPSFLSFIGKDVVVGHNVHFDVNFLYDNCERSGLPPFRNDFIDTMQISRRLYKDWPNHKLHTLIKELGIGSRDFHRAENDARLTGLAYLAMCQSPDYAAAMDPIRRGHAPGFTAKDIFAEDGLINEDSPLFGAVVVFTGALERFTRREAAQIVVNIGGICEDNVTKRTNFLVLGNNDYCSTIKGGKSSKQKKAEKLILEGADLQIIPETVFMDILTQDEKCEPIAPACESVEPYEIYEAAKPGLEAVLDKNWADRSLLAYEELQNYSSIKFDGSILFRVRGGQKPYMEIPSSGVSIPEAERRVGFYRISISDRDDAAKLFPYVEAVLQAQIDAIPKEFSCCSRYLDCSDRLACTNPDKDMAMHCGYRKVMMGGKVFYGKNRNV